MKKTWNHPQLGIFEYDKDTDRWVGMAELPAFKIFAWDADSKPTGKYEIYFESKGGKEPSSESAEIAALVVTNQAKLAPLIAPALWEDFNGRGGTSGMWWHGDMAEVVANFGYDSRKAPKDAKDLVSALGFTGVNIPEQFNKKVGPVAELSFRSLIDEEHGIGLLTNGHKIIGSGYAGESDPFK